MGHDLAPVVPPQVIELEILTRLPVKSLLRFKSVCKSWNLLITSPEFIDKHHHVGGVDEDTALVWSRFGYRTDCSYDYFDPELTVIIGCINGLVCFCNCLENNQTIRGIWIWNPATKQRMEVPCMTHEYDARLDFFGFGYDSAARDFKVIEGYFDHTEQLQPLIGNIYSCNSGCWTKSAPSSFLYDGGLDKHCYATVDGSLYWLLGPVQSLIIVMFDVKPEVFRLLPELGSIDHITKQPCDMMSLRDSLAVMFCDERSIFHGEVDVYVFNEKCSVWSKTSIGAFMIKEPTYTPDMQYYLVASFRNGDVLFVSDDLELICINLESHTVKNMRTLGKEGYFCMFPCYGGWEYSESLVFIEGMMSAPYAWEGIFFLTPFAPNLIRGESWPRTKKALDQEIESAKTDVS